MKWLKAALTCTLRAGRGGAQGDQVKRGCGGAGSLSAPDRWRWTCGRSRR